MVDLNELQNMPTVFTVSVTQSLSPESWANLTNWRERVFPEEGVPYAWRSLPLHAIAKTQTNDVVAHIGFGPCLIECAGTTITVIGVGGVVVRPEFQGHGVPAQLFNAVHTYYDTVPAAGTNLEPPTYALFCPGRLTPYYRKHGYEVLRHSVTVMQQGTITKIPFTVMTYPRALNGDIHVPSNPW